MPGVPLDVMDKFKAIFRRKSKADPGPSATAGTKTEPPNQAATPTQVPPATQTTTGNTPAPSSSQPVAPAGAAPVTTESGVDKPAEPTPGSAPTPTDPTPPAANPTTAAKDEAAAVAAK